MASVSKEWDSTLKSCRAAFAGSAAAIVLVTIDKALDLQCSAYIAVAQYTGAMLGATVLECINDSRSDGWFRMPSLGVLGGSLASGAVAGGPFIS